MTYTALWLEDDLNDIPQFCQDISNTLDVKIHFAKSIVAAKTIVKDHHIDLFLLDIEMASKRITGIEYAQHLRSSQEYCQTPIIFVSGHSYLARHLFATVQNCSLLSKPYIAAELENTIGRALGIMDYVKNDGIDESLHIPVKGGKTVEVDSRKISYVEFLKDNVVRVQLHNNKKLTVHCQRGVRKSILAWIKQNPKTNLVQIYRSVIVNVNEIKEVKLDGHEGTVYLFGDNTPKSLGIRYRANVKNFL